MSARFSDSLLAYDPSQNGVSNAQFGASAGGGNISGAGNFYSQPSDVRSINTVAELVKITGTLTGTLTIEVTNDDEKTDKAGAADWVQFTATIPAINGVGSFGLSNPIPYGRYRLKFVWASGAGTLKTRRMLKGAA